jgi:hypothetical protein
MIKKHTGVKIGEEIERELDIEDFFVLVKCISDSLPSLRLHSNSVDLPWLYTDIMYQV